MGRALIDLTGQTFGKWYVVSRATGKSSRLVMWLCECRCADRNRKVVFGANLKNGSSTSCGCIKKGRKYGRKPATGAPKPKPVSVLRTTPPETFRSIDEQEMAEQWGIYFDEGAAIRMAEYARNNPIETRRAGHEAGGHGL